MCGQGRASSPITVHAAPTPGPQASRSRMELVTGCAATRRSRSRPSRRASGSPPGGPRCRRTTARARRTWRLFDHDPSLPGDRQPESDAGPPVHGRCSAALSRPWVTSPYGRCGTTSDAQSWADQLAGSLTPGRATGRSAAGRARARVTTPPSNQGIRTPALRARATAAPVPRSPPPVRPQVVDAHPLCAGRHDRRQLLRGVRRGAGVPAQRP